MGAALKFAEPDAESAASAPAQLARFSPRVPYRVTMSAAAVLDSHLRPVVDVRPSWMTYVMAALSDEVFEEPTSERLHAAQGLARLLDDAIWSEAPRPFVSPSGSDSFSAEFRGNGVEVHLEVGVRAGATVYVLEPGVLEWEGELADVPDGIGKWAWRLAHA